MRARAQAAALRLAAAQLIKPIRLRKKTRLKPRTYTNHEEVQGTDLLTGIGVVKCTHIYMDATFSLQRY